MRFFLDHDVPTEVARVLKQEGHEATELREVLPVGASDAEAFQFARQNDFFMITCNRDDYLALAAQEAYCGLIILFRRRTRQAECANLLALLDRAGESGLTGNINFA